MVSGSEQCVNMVMKAYIRQTVIRIISYCNNRSPLMLNYGLEILLPLSAITKIVSHLGGKAKVHLRPTHIKDTSGPPNTRQ